MTSQELIEMVSQNLNEAQLLNASALEIHELIAVLSDSAAKKRLHDQFMRKQETIKSLLIFNNKAIEELQRRRKA